MNPLRNAEQKPTTPLTYSFGGRFSLDRRWEAMVEVDSNFDDARMLIFSGSFRF